VVQRTTRPACLKRDLRVDEIYKEIQVMFLAGRTEPLSDAEMAELVAKPMPELEGAARRL
jgi:hypothetical protein